MITHALLYESRLAAAARICRHITKSSAVSLSPVPLTAMFYITLHENFTPDLIVKYSRLERVENAAKLEHPIIREAFDLVVLTVAVWN